MATVKNTDRLLKRLNNIANVDVKKTMEKATLMVHAQAKLLAPADTGNLRESIHQEVKTTSNSVEGRVFTNVQYAPYVEFGTGIKGNGSYPYKLKDIKLSYRNTPWVYTPDGGETFYYTKGQVAQPFMYPALKQNEKAIKEMFKDGVKAEIRKQCKGG
jgi:HK97 gp10 family phage protein